MEGYDQGVGDLLSESINLLLLPVTFVTVAKRSPNLPVVDLDAVVEVEGNAPVGIVAELLIKFPKLRLLLDQCVPALSPASDGVLSKSQRPMSPSN